MNVYRVEGTDDQGTIKFIHVGAKNIETAIAHGRAGGLDVYEARKALTDIQIAEESNGRH